MTSDFHLISCDWGTSAFRLRLLKGRERPRFLAERSSSRGILTFPGADAGEFQNYLIMELDRLFRSAKLSPESFPIYLSGMITSTLGWKELPYANLPFPLDGSGAIVEQMNLQRVYGTHELIFWSGLKSDDDVLRGEETELVGIHRQSDLMGWSSGYVAVLPGTHSKVIEVLNGTVLRFRTYLTGELFQVLRQHSILKHSLSEEMKPEEGAHEFFELGVRRAAEAGLLESLFTVRTNVLLKAIPREANTHYLSGLLIGTEVRSILSQFPASTPILLCGSRALQELYERTFQVLGESFRVHSVPEEISSVAASLGHWSLRSVVDTRVRHGG